MTARMMTATEHRAKVAAAMTEAQLLDGILGTPRNPGLALALGWLGYHTHRSQHSPAGFPDLVLVKGGRLIFAELKRQAASAKPTEEQRRWLAELGRVSDVGAALASYAPDYVDGITGGAPLVGAYLWRPRDLLDGIVEAVLRNGDTPAPGLALPRRTR